MLFVVFLCYVNFQKKHKKCIEIMLIFKKKHNKYKMPK